MSDSTLSGKERRILRSRGQTLPVAVIVGKAGLTDNVLANLRDTIARQPLMKVRLLGDSSSDRKALSTEIATALGAECVSGVGRSFLFFKEAPAEA